MYLAKPYFINLALTGIIPTKGLTPNVPVNVEEIVTDAAEAIALGVQMLHLHARDEHQMHSSEPALMGSIVERIRALPGGEETILCVTTSGRVDPGYQARCGVLDLEHRGKPDMASLTLSSLNFAQSASVNAPDTIRQLAIHMLSKGIKPELEVFDLGMANFVKVLAKEGLIKPPFYVNVLLGNVAGAQPSLIEVAAILAALPEESIVAIAGLGRFQLGANQLGLLYADGVRTGLEDNIWFDQNRQLLATNAALVKRIKQQAQVLERPEYARQALRQILGLL